MSQGFRANSRPVLVPVRLMESDYEERRMHEVRCK